MWTWERSRGSQPRSILDLVAQTGAQMLLEAAIEAKVEADLGRGRYECRSEDQQGYRNGAEHGR